MPAVDDSDDRLALRDAYISDEIFEFERERIFRRSWLYLCHESEIPDPGDFRLCELAGQSVLVTRDTDGQVHAFYNRCTHRGTMLCTEQRGNGRYLQCPYHGWTFAMDGHLATVALPGGYEGLLDREKHGLEPVANVALYRGFVFGNAASECPTLDEWLGPARSSVDAFVDQSPTGRIRLTAGTHRIRFHANWKWVGMDGYHPNFVHRSLRDALGTSEDAEQTVSESTSPMNLQELTEERSPNRTRDLGNGHVRMDYWPSRLAQRDEHIATLVQSPAGREYLGRLAARVGDDRAKDLIAAGSPHAAIWPNLQLIGDHVRVLRPLAADLTEVEMTPALLDGAPDETNMHRIQQHEFQFGPAGFISPDDFIIFERGQVGLNAGTMPGIQLVRGLNREEHLQSGEIVGHYTDEVTQRGQLRQWKRQMAQAGDPT